MRYWNGFWSVFPLENQKIYNYKKLCVFNKILYWFPNVWRLSLSRQYVSCLSAVSPRLKTFCKFFVIKLFYTYLLYYLCNISFVLTSVLFRCWVFRQWGDSWGSTRNAGKGEEETTVGNTLQNEQKGGSICCQAVEWRMALERQR